MKKGTVLFRRSLKNAGWSVVDYALTPLLWLVATPFFIQRLGVSQYGIWMLMNSFLGFSGVVSFGLADATIKYVAKYRAMDNTPAIARVVRTNVAIYVFLGSLLCAVIFLSAPLVIQGLFTVEAEYVTLAIAALRVSAVGILIRMLDGIALSIFQGYERYDLAAKLTLPTNLAIMGTNVVLVALGSDILPLLVAMNMLLGVSAAIKFVLARRVLLPCLKFLPRFERDSFSEIREFALFSWLQGVGGIMLAHIDRFLIAALLGTASLTYYTVCLQLAQQIHMLLARAVAFIFPLVSVICEQEERDRLRKIYFRGLNLTTMAAVAAGVPLFFFAGDILSLWMGRDFSVQATPLLQILALVFTLWSTSIVPYYYMSGAGFVRLNTILGLVSGAIVTIGAALLIPKLGIFGAGLARFLTLPTSICGRTVVHYLVLHDRRWYAALPVFLPILFVFGVALAFRNMAVWPSLSLMGVLFWGMVASVASFLIVAILFTVFNGDKKSRGDWM